MENKAIIIAVGLALFSLGLGYQMGRHHGGESHTSSVNHETMTMAEMTNDLKGKTGDAFDQAFIESMIVHHAGAVEMAKLIPAQAKHEELKALGRDIISAQTKEIDLMRGWMKSWGYVK